MVLGLIVLDDEVEDLLDSHELAFIVEFSEVELGDVLPEGDRVGEHFWERTLAAALFEGVFLAVGQENVVEFETELRFIPGFTAVNPELGAEAHFASDVVGDVLEILEFVLNQGEF